MLGGGVGSRLRNLTRSRPAAGGFRLPGGRPLPGGRRPWLIGGGTLLLVAAALLTWAWWPDPEPQPLARQYRNVTACLLTGADGVTGPQAAPVWNGMQDASLATLAKVQFLEIDGPQTIENGRTFLATLAGSKCDVILTAGEVPNAVLSADAAKHANVRFIAVGGTGGGGNVSVVEGDSPDRVRQSVRTAVQAAVDAVAPR